MKARFYDPELGQFLTQDAWEGEIDTPPSLHKYLYAYMNPTVYWDPDGNMSVHKWVDEEGIVHFGDAAAASSAGQGTEFSEGEKDRASRKEDRAARREAALGKCLQSGCGPISTGDEVRDAAIAASTISSFSRGVEVVGESKDSPGTTSDIEEIQKDRQKVANRAKQVADAAATTGDVIDAVVTPDATDVAATVVGGLPGLAANKARKAKKAVDANYVLNRKISMKGQGHAPQRHGGGVTDRQLQERARTGKTPDGQQGGIPKIASKFHSDKLMVEVDDQIRQTHLKNYIKVNPRATEFSIQRLETGKNLGRGYKRVAGGNPNTMTNQHGALQPVDNLSKVTAHYTKNPKTGQWDTITIWPGE